MSSPFIRSILARSVTGFDSLPLISTADYPHYFSVCRLSVLFSIIYPCRCSPQGRNLGPTRRWRMVRARLAARLQPILTIHCV